MVEKQKGTLIKLHTRRSFYSMILINLIFMACFIICLFVYATESKNSIYETNVGNIKDLADSKAALLQKALDNIGFEVERAYNYCEDDKSKTEVIQYLDTINGVDEEYQLLRFNKTESSDLFYVYDGLSTKKKNGVYQSVKYSDSALTNSLYTHQTNSYGDVSFTQSFTNQTDTLRYFAAFCSIVIEGEEYYLVKLQREERVLNFIQIKNEYENLSVAVCYNDGKYLASDGDFRANNFFDYIYNSNELTLDEKNKLINDINNDEDGTGTLEYKNNKGDDCIYAYSFSDDSRSLLTIVSISTNHFFDERATSYIPWIIVLFLVGLLMFNVLSLMFMVIQLKNSVKREQFANSSKSAFLSRMSHEIRTPLNAIIGYNSIARDEFSTVKDENDRRNAEMKVLDCLTKSEIASKQLLFVINDVLDMSAIESGKIKIVSEKFDFRGLITTLAMVFYSQAKNKGIKFDVTFSTITGEWFIGDQMRVNQVLTNLLSNAIKFTPSGGAVHLRISQPNVNEEVSHIRFEIVDTGIGMTDEYIKRIWNPFEQADASISRRFGGTGLGLTISKTLVDLMNGTIDVNSTIGVGSTFVVEIPFGVSKQPEIDSSVYDFSSINVLVVDDDEATCDYIRSLFNRYGVKCVTVLSGQEAVNAVKMSYESNDHYTVCLVDWQMPGMDGIETIQRIREVSEDKIPIIVISAYDFVEIADEAAKYGVNRFIAKPFFQSTLFDLLADITGKTEVKAKRKPEDFRFDGQKLLLVEDNEMNMEVAKTILEYAGLVVECAYNGIEAVEMFERSEKGYYSAILMDVHMPKMDGLEATKVIRKSNHLEASSIPIIAMTADAFVEDIEETKISGMNDHISKPIDVKRLFDVLSNYMSRKK